MPLSILTTTSPGAHDWSIAVKAPTPPAPRPYPTDVGNPITGTSTSPATTDGKAPSIPAATTTTSTAASANRSNGVTRRCKPATPTSQASSTVQPISAATSDASAATGISDVPALRIPTTPLRFG